MPDKRTNSDTADYLLAWFAKFSPESQQFIRDDMEALEERQAIVDCGPIERTISEIDALEARARIVLERPERFPGAHYCARTLIQQDIPRWKAEIHANGRHFRRIVE